MELLYLHRTPSANFASANEDLDCQMSLASAGRGFRGVADWDAVDKKQLVF